jgi:DNA-binding SARP family transcriptional activator
MDQRDQTGVTPREYFRRLFQQASVQLAELYVAAGALNESVDVYRELTDIDPADERLWQALFRVHAERRDASALIREERRMRQALRDLAAEEDDPTADPRLEEPSRETTREFRRLLAGLREREPATA